MVVSASSGLPLCGLSDFECRKSGLPRSLVARTTAACVSFRPMLRRWGCSPVIAAHLHDLVALSLGPTRDAVAAAAASLRAARLQAIKRDVAARLLDDPDLN